MSFIEFRLESFFFFFFSRSNIVIRCAGSAYCLVVRFQIFIFLRFAFFCRKLFFIFDFRWLFMNNRWWLAFHFRFTHILTACKMLNFSYRNLFNESNAPSTVFLFLSYFFRCLY